MTASLKKYAKAVMASVLVFTLVLQLFQGMGYVLAQQNSTGPDTYTVTLTNAAQIYICNEKAPEGKVTLRYTVQSASQTCRQTGVAATTTPTADYPFDGGLGHMRYSGRVMTSVGGTYEVVMDLDASNEIVFSGSLLKADNSTVDLSTKYNETVANSAEAGTGNANATHFGIWISAQNAGETETAVLTNVSCVDEAGNDLGIIGKATTGTCVVEKNEIEEPTEPTTPDTYTVTLTNAAQIYICNEKAPEGKVTLRYTVQSASQTCRQTGVAATTDPTADYPFDGGLGHMRYSGRVMTSVGGTYEVVMDLDASNEIVFSGSLLKADNSTVDLSTKYNETVANSAEAGTGNANATHFGIWIDLGQVDASTPGTVETAVLTNVSCVDEAGNDLGIIGKATTGTCVVEKNEIEEPTEPTTPDTYTVTLTNAAQIYICNEKAPEGKVTLRYTVQSASQTCRQTGVAATTDPTADYPFDGGLGHMRYGGRLMTSVGGTYEVVMNLDASNKIVFSGSLLKADNSTVDLSTKYTETVTNSAEAGTGNANATHFGIWIDLGQVNASTPGTVETAVLTNVSCVDEAGNDLGIIGKATTGTCVVKKNGVDEPIIPDTPVIPDTPIEPDEKTYEEYTFADWGIYDSITEGTMIYRPTDKSLTSLDGVAISGTVNFGGRSGKWLRIGGTKNVKQGGFWIGGHSSGLYLTPQGIGGAGNFFPLNKSEWDAVKRGDIQLRLTFDKAEDASSWTVGVHVNGEFKGSYTMAGVNPGTYIGVTTGIQVKDIGPKEEGPIQQQSPEELGFKEITLNMFGLKKEATYKPGQTEGNMRYATYALSSLDMTYLNADVTFQKAQGGDSIRYASADGWRGIMITAIKEGLKVENAETGEGVFYSLEQMGLSNITETFNLKLGVDMGNFSTGQNSNGKAEKQCDEIKICIWINDTLIAKEVTLKNVIMAGKGIGIYTPQGEIILGTPSDAYTGIDFNLFGYTREWEKEIGLK